MSNPTTTTQTTTTTSLSLPNGTNPATELQFRLDNYFAAEQPPWNRLVAAGDDDDAGNGAAAEERLRRLKESIEGLVGVVERNDKPYPASSSAVFCSMYSTSAGGIEIGMAHATCTIWAGWP
ncbi:hypothetical protein VUR80DRAFT_7555 [Thermomyces stellatus]